MAAFAKLWTVDPTDRIERWLGDGSQDGWKAVTIPAAWKQRVATHGHLPHLRWKLTKEDADWKTLTLGEFHQLAQRVAAALIATGLQKCDCVSVLGFNAPEWFAAAHGGILAQCLAAGIYTTNNAGGVEYILQHSKSRILFVDSKAQLEKALSVVAKCPSLLRIVVWGPEAAACDGMANGMAVSWDKFLATGDAAAARAAAERQAAMHPGDACYLSYTSGTTGPPKAVMYSHDSVLFGFYTIYRHLAEGARGTPNQFDLTERQVSYMPLSHIAGSADIFSFLAHPKDTHICLYFAFPDAMQGSLPQTLKEVRPTAMLGVPRVWQKLELGLRAALQAKPELKNAPQQAMALVGLDAVKCAWTGAAPTPIETMQFYDSLGLQLLEVYGMTENTAVSTFNNMKRRLVGSVGPELIKGTTKIMPGSGEIVNRHRALMMGYMHNVAKTTEAIDADGWLRTGDIGTETSDGFIKITGRIKELIITAGGENIPPVLIEGVLKESLPPISNVVIIGDMQKMLVALFTLKQKPDATGGFTGELEMEAVGVDAAAKNVAAAKQSLAWKKLLDGAVERYNTKEATSRAQSIRSWAILDSDFSPVGADPELTPTLKLKRDVVHRKFGGVIKGLYGADFKPVPWASSAKL